jgi:hypothetical protein
MLRTSRKEGQRWGDSKCIPYLSTINDELSIAGFCGELGVFSKLDLATGFMSPDIVLLDNVSNSHVIGAFRA